MNRRGSTDFSFEEFVKLAASAFVAAMLIGAIVAVYLWWAAPDLKKDAATENILENFVDLIAAQRGDSWEVYTFVGLLPGQVLAGFEEGQERAGSPYWPRPLNCGGSCICIYTEVDVHDPETKPLSCKSIRYSDIEGERVGFSSSGTKPGFEIYRNGRGEAFHIKLSYQNGQLLLEEVD